MATNTGLETTAKSFDILLALREREGATLQELDDHLELPKSTIHRHLATLQDSGFIREEGGEYDIGFRFLELGEYTRNRKGAYQLAAEPVEDLAEETGERAQFVVEEHGEGV